MQELAEFRAYYDRKRIFLDANDDPSVLWRKVRDIRRREPSRHVTIVEVVRADPPIKTVSKWAMVEFIGEASNQERKP